MTPIPVTFKGLPQAVATAVQVLVNTWRDNMAVARPFAYQADPVDPAQVIITLSPDFVSTKPAVMLFRASNNPRNWQRGKLFDNARAANAGVVTLGSGATWYFGITAKLNSPLDPEL